MVQHTIGRTNLNGKTQEKIDVISMRAHWEKNICSFVFRQIQGKFHITAGPPEIG